MERGRLSCSRVRSAAGARSAARTRSFAHARAPRGRDISSETGSYAQIDDTSARVNGRNDYTALVCVERYAACFTTGRKDRLTVLDVLRRFRRRELLFDDEAARLLEQLRVSAFEYIRDRVSRLFRLPSLADMIRRRAAASARS
jgi:hypothetical protein